MRNRNKLMLWIAIDACLLVAIVAFVIIIFVQRNQNDGNGEPDGVNTTSTPTPGQEQNMGTTTPEPTQSVTPTESVTPEPTPEPTQSVTPTPEPTKEPTNTPEATPTPTVTPPLVSDISAYLEINGDPYGWCFKKNDTHNQPDDYGWGKALKFSSLNTYYVDTSATAEDPVVYLTFDCGYEYGYTSVILDVLKENNVKAVFFVTKPFIEEQPELAKRMKEEGHLVGNHTTTHPNLATLSPDKVIAEITECEEYFKSVTGYDMDKFCRPPEGSISPRVLNILNDMGYKTVLWSIAYLDYDVNNQPGEAYVIEQFTKYHHNGAIPLIHTVSQSNTEALPEVIQLLKDAGYRFGTVDELK